MVFAIAEVFAAALTLIMILFLAVDFTIAMAAIGFRMISLGLVAPWTAAFDATAVTVGTIAGVSSVAVVADMFHGIQTLGMLIHIKGIYVVVQFIAGIMAGNATGRDFVILILFMVHTSAVPVCSARLADVGCGEIMNIGHFIFIPAGMLFPAFDTPALLIIPLMNMLVSRAQAAFRSHGNA